MPIDLESNLKTLRSKLLVLGGKVERQLAIVTDAVVNGDANLARTVKKGDEDIDNDGIVSGTDLTMILAGWNAGLD